MPAKNETGIFGGGEMGEMLRAFDWSSTNLGSVWGQCLRTAVGICLNSRSPMAIFWGPELVMLYNDAFREIIGSKYSEAFGKRGRDCLSTVWPTIGPMLAGVMRGGGATRTDDLLLLIERNGFQEECYFTFSYSPIFDEAGQIGGAFVAVTDTTARVIHERRFRTLEELAAMRTYAGDVDGVLESAITALRDNPYDVPFAAVYLLAVMPDGCAGRPAVVSQAGLTVARAGELGFAVWDEIKACQNEMQGGVLQVIDNYDGRLGLLPEGAWNEPAKRCAVMPISGPAQKGLTGFLLMGVNPRKLLEPQYRNFFALIGTQICSAVTAAHIHEDQTERTKVLVELDRAKNVFFTNLSYEFRTPLTLMLGPLEAMMERAQPTAVVPVDELRLIHRNGMRLLRLVNSILDYSGIEAGRVQPLFEAVDLANFTREIAIGFRSAMEAAGLQFVVDCPALAQPAYVDREMWEKTVLNLTANALKFTQAGGVTVRLAENGDRLELMVSDTGVGVAESELAELNRLNRFYRPSQPGGRSAARAGIGLALTMELIRLHGGTMRVESQLGEGSRFIVSIPKGSSHIPSGKMTSARIAGATGAMVSAYLDEELRGISEANKPIASFASNEVRAPHVVTASGRILVAEDDADMRQYIHRLLAASYEVQMTSDCSQAIHEALHNPPDLILTDVVMLGGSGCELVRLLRSHETTKTIPVILLSALAGEDARVEGLTSGADDYIVKPFTARELLARVGAHLSMGRLRKEAMERESLLRAQAEEARQQSNQLLESISDAFFSLDRDWRFSYLNPAAERTTGTNGRELEGQVLWEAFPELIGTDLEWRYRQAAEQRVATRFEFFFKPFQRWFDLKVYPAAGGGVTIISQDITEYRELQNAKLRDAWLVRMEASREEERKRLSRELHDELGQLLTAIKMDLRWMEQELDPMSEDQRLNPLLDKIMSTVELTDETIHVVQRIAADLRPGVLDKLGLAMALMHEANRFEERTGIRCHVAAQEEHAAMHTEIATAFFRIFQEAITNIMRHAQATEVHVVLKAEAGGVRLNIQDNGIGGVSDQLGKPASLGLLGMQERARSWKGEVTFAGVASGGTLISAWIPNRVGEEVA